MTKADWKLGQKAILWRPALGQYAEPERRDTWIVISVGRKWVEARAEWSSLVRRFCLATGEPEHYMNGANLFPSEQHLQAHIAAVAAEREMRALRDEVCEKFRRIGTYELHMLTQDQLKKLKATLIEIGWMKAEVSA